ncbi:hypothetical protein BS50DRAFT_631558 [Corynespora cassiicola Philippines]|uniref:Uncharacterized protein n=1 Tax=Corynespora cassiicola Philippines TaxID=1448308 RepID=A0A2T2NWT1_CORCC|nr:hypothetical protein BS50DRAFT_631558 [Corynespora cassiicola Philippines]
MRSTTTTTICLGTLASAWARPYSAQPWDGDSVMYGNMFVAGPTAKGVTLTKVTFNRALAQSDDEQLCIALSTDTPEDEQSSDAGSQADFEFTVEETVSQRRLLRRANECYLGSCGTLGAYSWTNITVHLPGVDLDFGQTMLLMRATGDGFKTSDGGKTWTSAKLTKHKDRHFAN